MHSNERAKMDADRRTNHIVLPSCIRGYHIYNEVWTAAQLHESISCFAIGTYLFFGPRLLLPDCCIALTTSLLAEAIAEEGITVDNEPFGCGIKSLDYKNQSSESCAGITRSRLEQAGNVVRQKTLTIRNI